MPQKKKHSKKRRQAPENPDEVKPPQSIVIRRGKVGRSMKILVQDFREVMLPNTALKLKERKSNNVKDFVSVAGQLNVSHLVVFSSTDSGAYVRFMKMPQGPTLTFKIHEYSLSKDVHATQQHPHTSGSHFKTPPLVVLNNFGTEREHQLMTATFQSLFPMINVQTFSLTDCRRVVLLNYDKETQRIDFRHYLITVKPHGISKSIKRLVLPKNAKDIPQLGQFDDIADYVLGNAQPSESDVEDGPENTVNLPDKYVGKGNRKAEQSAVRLVELGPRLSLQLVKIQEGFGEGEVLYHSFVKKSAAEAEQLRQQKAKEKHEKELRRKEQEENYNRKHGIVKEGEGEEDAEKGEDGANGDVKDEEDEEEKAEQKSADGFYDSDIEEPSDSEDEEDELEIKYEKERNRKAAKESGANVDNVVEIKEEKEDSDEEEEKPKGKEKKRRASKKHKKHSIEAEPIEIKEEEDGSSSGELKEEGKEEGEGDGDAAEVFYQSERGYRPRPRDIAKVYKKENKRLYRANQFGRGKKEPLIGSAKKMRR